MNQDAQCDCGSLTDEALVLETHAQNQTALVTLILRYQTLARALTQGYVVAGLEADDLVQEALIGLLKAIRSFREEYGVPFGAYASLCMKRQIHSTIKAGLAGKQRPLSNYLPLEESLHYIPSDPLNTSTESPECLLIRDEEAFSRAQHIQSLLSAFEQEALNLYLGGCSYEEMAQRLNSTTKSVDNALQRVRRKLRSMKLS